MYRSMHQQDVGNAGKIARKLFERIIHEHGAFLSREELQFVYRKYGGGVSSLAGEDNPEEQNIEY